MHMLQSFFASSKAQVCISLLFPFSHVVHWNVSASFRCPGVVMQGRGLSVTAQLQPSVSALHAVYGHAGRRIVCPDIIELQLNVSELHILFGHAGQRTVCHSVTVIWWTRALS